MLSSALRSDDRATPTVRGDRADEIISGSEFILMVEDWQNTEASRTVQQNPFWTRLIEHPGEVPDEVYFGLCIENYHLLFRESYFDSPVLSFADSHRIRVLINEFYAEELGHDQLLLKSLQSIGLSKENLFRSAPLQSTMALCNALSYWARHDPIFFFTTLGPLEGRDVEIDSFVLAAQKKGLPNAFVQPIEAHAQINKDGEHGLLTRKIFEHIPAVSASEVRRYRAMTTLFFRIYDQFYRAILDFYSTANDLLRPVR